MISIGLNLILGAMLFLALVLGLRLEGKLRALRQSHLDFAKAVSELDQAAVRTESSLAALRAGAESVRGDLAARIDQARLAAQRLEKMTAEAETMLSRPLPLTQPLTQPLAAPPARPAPEPVAALRPVPAAAPRPVPASRSRAPVDDDLFVSEPERRPALAAVRGGRR